MEEGYRRLSFMMLDEDIAAVSPSTVYRILKDAGLLATKWRYEKTKGSGFHQPTRPHQHRHLDITNINFRGTFVYLASLIDGFSRLPTQNVFFLKLPRPVLRGMAEGKRISFSG